MFQQKTVKAFAIVAIVLSLLGLLLSVLGTLVMQGGSATFAFYMGIVSWAILLWASIIGYKLCTPAYTLYEDEYKKVGIRIYMIIGAFVLFFFVGLVVGLVLSVILLATLWALKSNYDDWKWNNTDPIIPETVGNEEKLMDTTNSSNH